MIGEVNGPLSPPQQQVSLDTAPPGGLSVGLQCLGKGVGLTTMRQELTDSAEMAVGSSDHTVMVWRRGSARTKEVVFDAGRGAAIAPRPGSLWIVPAGYRATALMCGAEFEVRKLLVAPSLLVGSPLHPSVGRRDVIVHSLIERIAGTANRSDVIARLLRESLADALRLHLLDAYGAEPGMREVQGRGLDAAARQMLVDYLNDSLDGSVNLEVLADLVGMSISGFRRAFAEAFSTTPHQYVLDLRIQKAKSLLAATTLTMAEISELTGFSSPSHFASTFRSRVGCSPTAYRAETR